MSQSKLVAVVGPTAAGKTELAIQLSLRLQGEIITADSRQIYRNLDCGTGKPTSEQTRQVRHHLLSQIDPLQVVTAEDFSKMAWKAYCEIVARGKICFVVGGTGLWIQAFLDGLAPVPPADQGIRNNLRGRMDREGLAKLYLQLEQEDPETAKKLQPADSIRIIRALEILQLTGIKPSELRRQKSIQPALPAVWLGISRPRKQLYRLAENKIEAWMQQGWLPEVEKLLKSGIPAESPAMQAIGYSHLARHLQGEYSLEQAVDLIKRDTRRYIKRQMTWFRKESRIHWLDASQPQEDLIQEAVLIIASHQNHTSFNP